MRRRRSAMSAWQVFADLLTCILGYFMLIAVILIVVPHQPKKTHDGIKPKAEYLLVLTWNDGRDVDLDLWLHHGSCTIYYNARECKNISLDRDSRGVLSNTSVNTDGTVVRSPNQEVIAIRAVLPGDFLTAVNYYQDHEPPGTQPGIDCKVELVRLNPVVTVVKQVNLHLDMERQTLNAIAFHLSADGRIDLIAPPPEDLISLYGKPNP